MKLSVRGWQRSNQTQTVYLTPICEVEQRTDNTVIPTGITKVDEDGISISFLGKANCSAQSNYLFSVNLTNDDTVEIIRRNYRIDERISKQTIIDAIRNIEYDECY